MKLLDFVSPIIPVEVVTDFELLSRLRTGWCEGYAAFILTHDGPDALFVHFHEDAAYLWFAPDQTGQHPGFVPDGMWSGERQDMSFRIMGGGSETITVPWQHLMRIDSACDAACEYLNSREMPRSVLWMELCS